MDKIFDPEVETYLKDLGTSQEGQFFSINTHPMLEPILLTEEWLLKFGFKLKDSTNEGYTIPINFSYMKDFFILF